MQNGLSSLTIEKIIYYWHFIFAISLFGCLPVLDARGRRPVRPPSTRHCLHLIRPSVSNNFPRVLQRNICSSFSFGMFHAAVCNSNQRYQRYSNSNHRVNEHFQILRKSFLLTHVENRVKICSTDDSHQGRGDQDKKYISADKYISDILCLTTSVNFCNLSSSRCSLFGAELKGPLYRVSIAVVPNRGAAAG